MKKNIVTRLTEQLQAKGMDPGKARAVAVSKMRDAGNVDQSGALTPKGKKRTAMGAAGRAKDRAAQASGRSASEYSYNQLNNTARLKNAGR